MKYYSVAIDGPAGSGKSTVARRVAEHLGFTYVDSGAMYRAVAWQALNQSADFHNDTEIEQIAKELHFQLDKNGWLINGERIDSLLRSPQVSQYASNVAKTIGVRKILVAKQQEIASKNHVVMDGRDIGNHVLPHADVKIYLTASVEERAKRRLNEQQKRGYDGDLQLIMKEIERRDEQDQTREISPLRQASDAVRIDTTSRSVQQIVDEIVTICCTKMGGEE
ncbi:cytidylate kinase [Seinonella peptonophila]|uniref:Cytidylate kinase n=1 Tax=Seinonella peptonophila TaxID=112248 RepID=A0A1M4THE1_9BACL|nr:(d)CMP kinase [Seinonella peptonophila]SHE43856.1 cytidylate kinase [Seinonella peptonophila]